MCSKSEACSSAKYNIIVCINQSYKKRNNIISVIAIIKLLGQDSTWGSNPMKVCNVVLSH